jgi:hypothetical protein
MTPFRHIMVPYDFSDFAKAALARAVDLAKRYGARVTLVHVYQPLIAAIPDGLVLYSADQFADFHNKVAAQLDVAKADAERAGIANVETEVRQGRAAHRDGAVRARQRGGPDRDGQPWPHRPWRTRSSARWPRRSSARPRAPCWWCAAITERRYGAPLASRCACTCLA